MWLLIHSQSILGPDGQSPHTSDAVVRSVTRLLSCLAKFYNGRCPTCKVCPHISRGSLPSGLPDAISLPTFPATKLKHSVSRASNKGIFNMDKKHTRSIFLRCRTDEYATYCTKWFGGRSQVRLNELIVMKQWMHARLLCLLFWCS